MEEKTSEIGTVVWKAEVCWLLYTAHCLPIAFPPIYPLRFGQSHLFFLMAPTVNVSKEDSKMAEGNSFSF